MEDHKLFEAVGSAVFGGDATSGLSRALDIDHRTIRRMLSGEAPIKPGIWCDLHRITLEAAQSLEDEAADMARRAKMLDQLSEQVMSKGRA